MKLIWEIKNCHLNFKTKEIDALVDAAILVYHAVLRSRTPLERWILALIYFLSCKGFYEGQKPFKLRWESWALRLLNGLIKGSKCQICEDNFKKFPAAKPAGRK